MPNVCIINGVKITSKEDSKRKTTNNDSNTAANAQGIFTNDERFKKALVAERKQIAKEKEERKRQAIKDQKALMINYNAYLDFVFTLSTTSGGGSGVTYVKRTTTSTSTKVYFESNPKVVERGFNALRNKYITENRKRLEDKGQPHARVYTN